MSSQKVSGKSAVIVLKGKTYTGVLTFDWSAKNASEVVSGGTEILPSGYTQGPVTYDLSFEMNYEDGEAFEMDIDFEAGEQFDILQIIKKANGQTFTNTFKTCVLTEISSPQSDGPSTYSFTANCLSRIKNGIVPLAS